MTASSKKTVIELELTEREANFVQAVLANVRLTGVGSIASEIMTALDEVAIDGECFSVTLRNDCIVVDEEEDDEDNE